MFGLRAVMRDPTPYTARPMENTRRLPQMSPSFAPVSMKAAITRGYAVMASCTSGTVVFRSSTTCEIDTFMTVLSSTMMNCAVPSRRMVVRFFISGPAPLPAGSGVRALEDLRLLGVELLVAQHALVVERGRTVELVEAVGHRVPRPAVGR